MSDLQLEFNIDKKSPEEFQIYLMQKQIDQMSDSLGKVRRRLFSEMGEMKKLYGELHKENLELKTIVKELTHEKTEWTYGQNGYLFDVQEYQRKVC